MGSGGASPLSENLKRGVKQNPDSLQVFGRPLSVCPLCVRCLPAAVGRKPLLPPGSRGVLSPAPPRLRLHTGASFSSFRGGSAAAVVVNNRSVSVRVVSVRVQVCKVAGFPRPPPPPSFF